MKNIKYYIDLPEAIEQEVIELEVKELLENKENLGDGLIVQALLELSERQVINYSRVDDKIKKEIALFLISKWDGDSAVDTATYIAIMINFGIQGFYDFLKKEMDNITNQNILAELREVFFEFGENIEDVSFKIN